MALDFTPRRTAAAGKVDGRNAGVEERAYVARRDPPADFFDDDREIGVTTEALDLHKQTAKRDVALTLHRFLKRIKMEHERIGAQELHQATAVVDRVAFVQLNRAKIRKERHVRGLGTHVKSV